MKDLGPAWHILGMKISLLRNQWQLFLSQADYIKCVLERLNMHSVKFASTPLPLSLQLSHRDCTRSALEVEDMKSVPYAPTFDSLMYAMVTSHDTVWYCSHCRKRQQIHAQPQSTTLECSQARPWHPLQPEQALRHSWLHQLGLCRLCRQPKVDNRILLQFQHWSNFMEVKTLGVHGHFNHRSRIRCRDIMMFSTQCVKSPRIWNKIVLQINNFVSNKNTFHLSKRMPYEWKVKDWI